MENILSLIKFLSTPFEPEYDAKNRKEPAKSPSLLLTSVIDSCLESLELRDPSPNKTYIEAPGNSPTWKYTCLILEVLKQLQFQIEMAEQNMSETEKSIEVLSLQSQIYVQTSVELVVGFGVLPYLFPGVGMPEKLRKVNINSEMFVLEDKNVSQLEQFFRLSHVVKSLLAISSHPILTTIIVHKHTCDILSALLQLCKSPLKKPLPCGDGRAESKETITSIQNPGLSFDEYSRVLREREELNNLFYNQFLSSSPRGTLVNSLLLIGSATRPRWIAKSCREILSSLLLSSETGLFTIAQAVLESLGRSSLWKVTRVISNLLQEAIHLNNDNEDGKLLESRLVNLSSQAYDMLLTLSSTSTSGGIEMEVTQSAKDTETNEQLTMIALTSGLMLFNMNPQIAINHFWCRLFDPFLKLSRSSAV